MNIIDINSDKFLKELEEIFPEKYLTIIGFEKFQLFSLNSFVEHNNISVGSFDPTEYKSYLDKMWRVK